MKTLIILLMCSAVLLAAANVFLRTRTQPAAIARPVTTVDSATGKTAKDKAEPATNNTAPAENIAALRWDKMESADYKAYIRNLRQVGFPEELIREIIIADVNKMYADRETALNIPPVPPDAPIGARGRKPTAEDIENLLKLRDMQIEKHALMEQLLGLKVPREIIRTPNSRNYEAAEYAVRRLPAEKQQQALEIFEKEVLLDDMNQAQGLRGAEELAAYRRVNEERDAALQALLTPDEFQRFIMNATPPGTEMQRRVMGMEPTDDELLAMWKVTQEHWKEQGGVFGRWRAERVPPDQLLAADQKLDENLRAALGPERFVDYQLATSGTGQQLRNFAARYDLPREKLLDAFRVQKEIQGLESAEQLKARYGAGFTPGPNGGKTLNASQQEMEKILGADLYNSWNEGRDLKYDLQP